MVSDNKLAGPGTSFHQSLLTGSHQYLLHYKISPTQNSEKPLKFLFISRKNFEEACNRVNNQQISKLVEHLDTIPAFINISKAIRRKIVQNSKLMALPKGWQFNSQE